MHAKSSRKRSFSLCLPVYGGDLSRLLPYEQTSVQLLGEVVLRVGEEDNACMSVQRHKNTQTMQKVSSKYTQCRYVFRLRASGVTRLALSHMCMLSCILTCISKKRGCSQFSALITHIRLTLWPAECVHTSDLMCTFVCMHAHNTDIDTNTDTDTHTHMHACMHVNMRRYAHRQIFACLYVCMSICAGVGP
jgi:hypothetical protein